MTLIPKGKATECFRWGFSLAGTVLGALALILVLRMKAERRGPEPVPVASEPTRAPSLQTSQKENLPPLALRPADSAPPEGIAHARPGRLTGHVFFPFFEKGRRAYSYQILVFAADGRMEGPHTVSNSDRFEIALTPGRKAIVFFSMSEDLTCPYQIAAVPDGGEVEVTLRPAIPHFLKGRVVDVSGAPLGGVYVTASESASLPQELYLQGRPATVETLTSPVYLPSAPNAGVVAPGDSPPGYVRIDPAEGRFARSTVTDAQGRFTLPLSSNVLPVPLSVTRNLTDLLKEETVLPSSGFARIVVPAQ